ncbi:hypothetical protein D3C71_1618130 [compost metagenome]
MRGLGTRRQGLGPRLFDIPPTPEINQQAARDGAQERTGFAHISKPLPSRQQRQERVLSQVGSLMIVLKTAIQPTLQPAAMRAVQVGKRCANCVLSVRHGERP